MSDNEARFVEKHLTCKIEKLTVLNKYLNCFNFVTWQSFKRVT